MFYTYLLRSTKNESFYVGISSDPNRRLLEHNSGILKSTAIKRPWELVFIREHQDCTEARKHEKWLKKKDKEYKNFLASMWMNTKSEAMKTPPDIRRGKV